MGDPARHRASGFMASELCSNMHPGGRPASRSTTPRRSTQLKGVHESSMMRTAAEPQGHAVTAEARERGDSISQSGPAGSGVSKEEESGARYAAFRGAPIWIAMGMP